MTQSRTEMGDAAEKVIQQVRDEHVAVSGVIAIANEIWAIYGFIPVDGEILVAEFDNRADADWALDRIAAPELS